MKLIKLDEQGNILGQVNAAVGTEQLYLDMGYVPGEHPPDHHYRWNDNQWVINLSSIKEQAKQRITTIRNHLEKQGFTAYGKVFDSDSSAIQRISVAVQAAQAVGETFSIEWTCADNSTITLDYAQMQALPAYMAEAANVLHIQARELKALINAAETIEEIEAIQWS